MRTRTIAVALVAFAAVIAALAAAGGVGATTYVLGSDAELAEQAALVVEGTVERVGPVADVALPATEARVRVERRLKGEAIGAALRVRVLGGERADGRRLQVWGAPRFAAGERVLLFLMPHADGAYRPLHFALGVFHARERDGRLLALRDLAEARLLAADGGEARERARDFAGFGRWLADRQAGLRRAPDYFVDLPAGTTPLADAFTYLDGNKYRWFEFDGGQSVGWRAHESGQAGLEGGGFAEFQAAIDAWNNDNGSNVRYSYDGTTTAAGGFEDFDGVNALLFDDPNNEMGGTFVCSQPGRGSGTLAIGGAWSGEVRDGVRVIAGGDIITNDGVGCWFVTGKRAEQVFGHELGHTLGLGHSCGDERSGECASSATRQALMRAQAHADDRGASLNEDDRAGIASLYGGGGGGGGGSKPAAPTGLAATVASSTAIDLAWSDNATNETSYRVERKSGAYGGFSEILQLPADSTAVTVTGLAASTNYTFRVRARNGSGPSGYSNNVTARTQDPPPPPLPAAPSELEAEPLSATEVRLTWKDNASNETGFRVEVSDPRDPFLGIEAPPANATSIVLGGLGPDFPYTFRVRAENLAGVSAFSNEANVTIPSAAPCVVTAQNLCLLEGRFRVMVQWRIPSTSANGIATAIPNSDRTGLFWFFSEANIELIVKVLDGRALTNAFWTFYGGLSDVEYWVSVTDVTNGDTATYHNPPGNFCGDADVDSFPQSGSAAADRLAAPAVTRVTAAACAPGTLCLAGGRFQVEVTWRNPAASGIGTAIPYGDVSGFFWFTDPAVIELVTKVIVAGTDVNGKIWFFYGALSDVEYDLKVTDTATGAVRTYHNPQGNLCGQADTSAF